MRRARIYLVGWGERAPSKSLNYLRVIFLDKIFLQICDIDHALYSFFDILIAMILNINYR